MADSEPSSPDVQLTLFDQDFGVRPSWCWVCESERTAPVQCGPACLQPSNQGTT